MAVPSLVTFHRRDAEGVWNFGLEKPLRSQSLMSCLGTVEANAESSGWWFVLCVFRGKREGLCKALRSLSM